MPKLIQDGVVIMHPFYQSLRSSSKRLFFEEFDFHSQTEPKINHQATKLIVKESENINYKFAYNNDLKFSNEDTTKPVQGFNISNNHLIQSSASKIKLHNTFHKDDLCKQQVTDKRKNFNKINIREKASYTRKAFRSPTPSFPREYEPDNQTIHSIDCPNFMRDHFPEYHYRQLSRESSREYQKQQKRHPNSNFKSDSKQLNYKISNVKDSLNPLKDHSSRSSTESTQLEVASSACSQMSNCLASDLSKHITTNIIDDSSRLLFTGVNFEVDSSPNNKKKAGVDTENDRHPQKCCKEEMPILVALPLPIFDMPGPPQLYQLHKPSSYQSSNLGLNQLNEKTNQLSKSFSKLPIAKEVNTVNKKPPTIQIRSSSMNNILDNTCVFHENKEHSYQNNLNEENELQFKRTFHESFSNLAAQNEAKTQKENFYINSLQDGINQNHEHTGNNLETLKSSKKDNSKYATFNSNAYTHLKTHHTNQKQLDEGLTKSLKKSSDTPILDALTALMTSAPFVESIDSSKPCAVETSQDQTQPAGYQASIYVGSMYTCANVVVNLEVNEDDPSNLTNRLTVLCYKSKNLSGEAILKQEILVPSNVDLKTIQSYLDDGYLNFTWNISSKKLKDSTASSSLTTITSQQTNSGNSSSNQLYFLNSCTNSMTLKSQNVSCDAPEIQGDLVFENPVYTNFKDKIVENKSDPKPLTEDLTEDILNENVGEPLRLIKGIASNIRRCKLASKSLRRIFSEVNSEINGSLKQDECEKNYSCRMQKRRSYSLPNNQRTVKFDIESDKYNGSKKIYGVQRLERSRILSTSSRPSKFSRQNIKLELIEDGFNCITKDGLDNVFLTYFFKLPACSPADRTQVRIEKHNILKLKIIQEKKYETSRSYKTVKKKGKSVDKVKADEKLKKLPSWSSSSDSVSSSNNQPSNITVSSNECSSNPTALSTSLGTSYTFSLPSTTTHSSSIALRSMYNDSALVSEDSSNEVILREFSRKCRLPNFIFKFDEDNITVSFVNNVWVRVEIPIVEILDSGLCKPMEKKKRKKKVSSTCNNRERVSRETAEIFYFADSRKNLSKIKSRPDHRFY